MSRFAPTDSEATELVVAANQRAELLARRIVTAEKAIKSGQSVMVVLAILGGSDD